MAPKPPISPSQAAPASPSGTGQPSQPANLQALMGTVSILPRGRRLQTTQGVRRAGADIFRRLETGAIPVDRARAMIAALQLVLQVLQGAETEDRMREIEANLGLNRR